MDKPTWLTQIGRKIDKWNFLIYSALLVLVSVISLIYRIRLLDETKTLEAAVGLLGFTAIFYGFTFGQGNSNFSKQIRRYINILERRELREYKKSVAKLKTRNDLRINMDSFKLEINEKFMRGSLKRVEFLVLLISVTLILAIAIDITYISGEMANKQAVNMFKWIKEIFIYFGIIGNAFLVGAWYAATKISKNR